jgi:hypothetical protein
MRYQAAIQRQLGQALTQLERLQRMRFGHAVPPPLSIDVRVTRELGAETLPRPARRRSRLVAPWAAPPSPWLSRPPRLRTTTARMTRANRLLTAPKKTTR